MSEEAAADDISPSLQ